MQQNSEQVSISKSELVKISYRVLLDTFDEMKKDVKYSSDHKIMIELRDRAAKEMINSTSLPSFNQPISKEGNKAFIKKALTKRKLLIEQIQDKDGIKKRFPGSYSMLMRVQQKFNRVISAHEWSSLHYDMVVYTVGEMLKDKTFAKDHQILLQLRLRAAKEMIEGLPEISFKGIWQASEGGAAAFKEISEAKMELLVKELGKERERLRMLFPDSYEGLMLIEQKANSRLYSHEWSEVLREVLNKMLKDKAYSADHEAMLKLRGRAVKEMVDGASMPSSYGPSISEEANFALIKKSEEKVKALIKERKEDAREMRKRFREYHPVIFFTEKRFNTRLSMAERSSLSYDIVIHAVQEMLKDETYAAEHEVLLKLGVQSAKEMIDGLPEPSHDALIKKEDGEEKRLLKVRSWVDLTSKSAAKMELLVKELGKERERLRMLFPDSYEGLMLIEQKANSRLYSHEWSEVLKKVLNEMLKDKAYSADHEAIFELRDRAVKEMVDGASMPSSYGPSISEEASSALIKKSGEKMKALIKERKEDARDMKERFPKHYSTLVFTEKRFNTKLYSYEWTSLCYDMVIYTVDEMLKDDSYSAVDHGIMMRLVLNSIREMTYDLPAPSFQVNTPPSKELGSAFILKSAVKMELLVKQLKEGKERLRMLFPDFYEELLLIERKANSRLYSYEWSEVLEEALRGMLGDNRYTADHEAIFKLRERVIKEMIDGASMPSSYGPSISKEASSALIKKSGDKAIKKRKEDARDMKKRFRISYALIIFTEKRFNIRLSTAERSNLSYDVLTDTVREMLKDESYASDHEALLVLGVQSTREMLEGQPSPSYCSLFITKEAGEQLMTERGWYSFIVKSTLRAGVLLKHLKKKKELLPDSHPLLDQSSDSANDLSDSGTQLQLFYDMALSISGDMLKDEIYSDEHELLIKLKAKAEKEIEDGLIDPSFELLETIKELIITKEGDHAYERKTERSMGLLIKGLKGYREDLEDLCGRFYPVVMFMGQGLNIYFTRFEWHQLFQEAIEYALEATDMKMADSLSYSVEEEEYTFCKEGDMSEDMSEEYITHDSFMSRMEKVMNEILNPSLDKEVVVHKNYGEKGPVGEEAWYGLRKEALARMKILVEQKKIEKKEGKEDTRKDHLLTYPILENKGDSLKNKEDPREVGIWSYPILKDNNYPTDINIVRRVEEILMSTTYEPATISHEIWLATIYEMLEMSDCASFDKETLLKAESLLLKKENLKSCNATPASNLLREALSESAKKVFQDIIKERWKKHRPWDESNLNGFYRDIDSKNKAKIKIYMEGGSSLYKEQKRDVSRPLMSNIFSNFCRDMENKKNAKIEIYINGKPSLYKEQKQDAEHPLMVVDESSIVSNFEIVGVKSPVDIQKSSENTENMLPELTKQGFFMQQKLDNEISEYEWRDLCYRATSDTIDEMIEDDIYTGDHEGLLYFGNRIPQDPNVNATVNSVLHRIAYPDYPHCLPPISEGGQNAYHKKYRARLELLTKELKKDKEDPIKAGFFSYPILKDNNYPTDINTVKKIEKMLLSATYEPATISHEIWLATIYEMLEADGCSSRDKEVLLKAENLLLKKENLKSCDAGPASNLLSELLSETATKAFQDIIKERWDTHRPWDEEHFDPSEMDMYMHKAKIKIYMEGGSSLYKGQKQYHFDSLVSPMKRMVVDESSIVSNFEIVKLKLLGDMQKSIVSLATIYQMLGMESCPSSDKEVLLEAEDSLLKGEMVKDSKPTHTSLLLNNMLSKSGKETFQGVAKIISNELRTDGPYLAEIFNKFETIKLESADDMRHTLSEIIKQILPYLNKNTELSNIAK